MNFSIPIKLVPHNLSLDFVGKRKIAFGFSIIITIAVICLLFFKGLNLGIDFAGGLAIEVSNIEVEEAREVMQKLGYKGFSIQEQVDRGEATVFLRVQPKNAENYNEEIEYIKGALSQGSTSNSISFQRIDYVGPKVGQDFINSAVQAMIVALLVMMAYTWYRFEWQFGLGVIIALLHDAIATIGFYIVSNYEFDLTSIAAILTVIGYSINDSVVIYDRIRENLKKYRNKAISTIINISINETLSRTIMTVATTLLVCGILAVFGGSSLEGFSMATLFGIAFGTYSSIYISAPILILLHRGKTRLGYHRDMVR